MVARLARTIERAAPGQIHRGDVADAAAVVGTAAAPQPTLRRPAGPWSGIGAGRHHAVVRVGARRLHRPAQHVCRLPHHRPILGDPCRRRGTGRLPGTHPAICVAAVVDSAQPGSAGCRWCRGLGRGVCRTHHLLADRLPGPAGGRAGAVVAAAPADAGADRCGAGPQHADRAAAVPGGGWAGCVAVSQCRLPRSAGTAGQCGGAAAPGAAQREAKRGDLGRGLGLGPAVGCRGAGGCAAGGQGCLHRLCRAEPGHRGLAAGRRRFRDAHVGWRRLRRPIGCQRGGGSGLGRRCGLAGSGSRGAATGSGLAGAGHQGAARLAD